MASRKPKNKAKRKADVAPLVIAFERDNNELLNTLNLFQISNEEYERAMRALTASPAVTASSSDAPHAIVVE